MIRLLFTKKLILLSIFLAVNTKAFSFTEENALLELKDSCDANIQRSYYISSPTFLCSSPNTESFLFSIEGKEVSEGYYVLKPNTTPILIEYINGTFSLELITVMKNDITKEYLIQISGSEKSIGKPNDGFTPAQNYCASMDNSNWTFYNNFKLTITGKQANNGQLFTFDSPQNNQHTFQIGLGANIWQPTLGSGLWFDNANKQLDKIATIKGDLQMNLTPIECCEKNICVPFVVIKNKRL